jgi:arabinose-5-phosphate isomerase
MGSLNEKKNYKKIAKNVIDLEIKALTRLKNSIGSSFNEAVEAITKCQSKVILCGVGKSGLIAAKISSTLSSVGTASFSLSANDCSHGDLGSISKKDILILISYSGSSEELKNIIKYANRNKILLIGIMSKKNSILYKASDIKLLIPEVIEAGLEIVPTSSTISQLSIGDALAVATIEKKKISKKDFKNFHPSGNLGAKLRTVSDLMIVGNKIPFVKESIKMKKAFQIISNKKLGVLVVRDDKKITTGIITDGQIRRFNSININLQDLTVKKVMTINPISVDQDTLAEKALAIMNSEKITSLCVHDRKNKKKTIGILHIHKILQSNIQ